jgi:hypothetical protein
MKPIKFRSHDNKKEMIILYKSIVNVRRTISDTNDYGEGHRDVYIYHYEVILNGTWCILQEDDLEEILHNMKFVEQE